MASSFCPLACILDVRLEKAPCPLTLDKIVLRLALEFLPIGWLVVILTALFYETRDGACIKTADAIRLVLYSLACACFGLLAIFVYGGAVKNGKDDDDDGI